VRFLLKKDQKNDKCSDLKHEWQKEIGTKEIGVGARRPSGGCVSSGRQKLKTVFDVRFKKPKTGFENARRTDVFKNA
jgi:hypothetical protein